MSNFKVGQKEVCCHNFKFQCEVERANGVVLPIRNEIYTIRSFIHDGQDLGLRFEEIVNPIIKYSDGVAEKAFLSTRFRPLDHQFAEDVIAEICKSVKEDELIPM